MPKKKQELRFRPTKLGPMPLNRRSTRAWVKTELTRAERMDQRKARARRWKEKGISPWFIDEKVS